MTVSVVMATYNGARYIKEQLDSILNQTRKADEVLIFDDCSTDNTVGIIKKFIKVNKLSNWHLIINEKNIGWKKNFVNGFHMTASDIIFCADQDDIWREEKLEIMARILEENDMISILASNIEEFCEDGVSKRSGPQIMDYGVHYIEQVQFDKMWLEPWRPGCSMAFKKRILPYIDKVWFEECPHDLVLWAVGIAKRDAYIVNQRLIYYRRHKNSGAPSNKKTKTVRTGLMEIYIKLAQNFLDCKQEISLSSSSVEKISKMKNFYLLRKSAIEQRTFRGLFGLLYYWKMYPKSTSWFADVISAYR